MAEQHVIPPNIETASQKTKTAQVFLNGNSINDQDIANGPHPSYPKSSLQLEDHYIDEPRKLKVIVIGAGLAGIVAGILLPAKVPGIDLHIYEKNDEVGGTWLENVYPGVRCDIPSHVYQATFSPNIEWSEKFAEGKEIRDYWQSQAHKYSVYQYIKLGTRVDDIIWNKEESVWELKLYNTRSGSTAIEKADFVLPAIGRFNSWRLPQYPGISSYQGLLRHASNWDPSFDPTGKRVAVIGNGASGIQLVPSLQRLAKQVDHYARNKTWIAASWAGDERTFDAQPFSQEDLDSFQDEEAYLKFRKGLEDKYWRNMRGFLRGSNENSEAREKFIGIMKERLSKKPELLDLLVPEFSPNCRRLTPGPGYLEAISEPNVDFIQTPIKRFTEKGIETIDGKYRDVDAIFCATGANIDMLPPFPIRAYGVDLRDAWKPDGQFGFPYTYLGLATPGFPNLLFIHGPHGTGPAGTVPHSVEVQITYFAKVLRKVSTQGIKTIKPSKAAADDFVHYSDAFFAKSVLSDNCSSWYNGGKAGSRIHGVWPGSAAHVTIVRREPRWEDWEYEYSTDTGNRFAYLGNGLTRMELELERDMTPYLRLPSTIDLRDLHESWWNIP